MVKIRNCLSDVKKLEKRCTDYKPNYRFDNTGDYNAFKDCIKELANKDEKFDLSYDDEMKFLYVNEEKFFFCKNEEPSKFIDEFFEALGVKYTDDVSVDEVKQVVNLIVEKPKDFAALIQSVESRMKTLDMIEKDFKENNTEKSCGKEGYDEVMALAETKRRNLTTELNDLQAQFENQAKTTVVKVFLAKINSIGVETYTDVVSKSVSKDWADEEN